MDNALPPHLTSIVAHLLTWYDDHAADLPWRENTHPYRIWLSEIMLQQTQVDTVIPYFTRFLERYPTIRALAEAPLDDVLKQWEGLGYYTRARNLHKASRVIAVEMDGQFPQTASELQQLPGIGRYTAGAVASIAFNEPVPVVDGNVIRVFARLMDLAEDVTQPKVVKSLWDIATQLVPERRPGDYNQSLMELGRTICKPRNPLCESCPLQADCLAFANGTQEERPVKKKKAPTPHYDVSAGLIRDDKNRLLIAQRPLDGLLGGLWEFPGGKQEDGETMPDCLKRELREELAIEVDVKDLFVKVRHAFTHFKITLHAYHCVYTGPTPPHDAPQKLGVRDYAWVTEQELSNYSFGRADRQVIDALEKRNSMLF